MRPVRELVAHLVLIDPSGPDKNAQILGSTKVFAEVDVIRNYVQGSPPHAKSPKATRAAFMYAACASSTVSNIPR